MSYSNHLNIDLRFHVLRVLANAPGYEANSAIIRAALDQVGHRRSAAMVEDALAYLAKVGAVTVRRLDDLQIARLATAGLDAVQGRSTLDGVRAPGPGEIDASPVVG